MNDVNSKEQMKSLPEPPRSYTVECNPQSLAILLCGVISAAAQAQSPGQNVSPGQLFAGSLLNAHAPDSAGWQLAGAGNNGLETEGKPTLVNSPL